jgi:hypothetical protein
MFSLRRAESGTARTPPGRAWFLGQSPHSGLCQEPQSLVLVASTRVEGINMRPGRWPYRWDQPRLALPGSGPRAHNRAWHPSAGTRHRCVVGHVSVAARPFFSGNAPASCSVSSSRRQSLRSNQTPVLIVGRSRVLIQCQCFATCEVEACSNIAVVIYREHIGDKLNVHAHPDEITRKRTELLLTH